MDTSRRYAGVSAEDRKAERRERLLDAAFDVFGREGYRKATMRLICAQARLTERYFYEHFESLHEVYVAVHRRLSAQAGAAIAASAPSKVTDPVEAMRSGLRCFFEFVRADARRGQILLMDAAIAGLSTPSQLNRQLMLFSALLQERLKARYPQLPQAPQPELIVSGFSGMVIHAASLWMERGFDWSVDTLVDHTAYAWTGLYAWLDSQRPH